MFLIKINFNKHYTNFYSGNKEKILTNPSSEIIQKIWIIYKEKNLLEGTRDIKDNKEIQI